MSLENELKRIADALEKLICSQVIPEKPVEPTAEEKPKPAPRKRAPAKKAVEKKPVEEAPAKKGAFVLPKTPTELADEAKANRSVTPPPATPVPVPPAVPGTSIEDAQNAVRSMSNEYIAASQDPHAAQAKCIKLLKSCGANQIFELDQAGIVKYEQGLKALINTPKGLG